MATQGVDHELRDGKHYVDKDTPRHHHIPSTRTALITGGASGIGRAIAFKLASRSINIVIGDMNPTAGEAVCAELSKQYGVQTKFQKTNVTLEEDVKRLVEVATELTGRLDFAANCAGVCENVWAEERSVTTEMFEQTWAVNTKGLWLCQKYEAMQMGKQEPRAIHFTPAPSHKIPGQRGSIANVASISGLQAAGLAAYTPSKYGAVAITKNGAKFYGPEGIRCNGLCPGWTLTPMVEHSMGKEGIAGSKENEQSTVSQTIALRRMAFAEEQANVLSFLLSDESSYMNGTLIVNDGGYHDIR